jgi:hypothetical protein
VNHVFAIDPSVLTVFVLVTCLVCIYMVFFFGRRLQTAAYLRDSLVEGAKQQELKVLLGEVHSRRIEGPLDPSCPPPDGYGSTRRLWDSNRYARPPEPEYATDYYVGAEPENDAARARHDTLVLEREKREAEREKREAGYRQWEKEEFARYNVLHQAAEADALKRAEKKVPASIDISLLGGGFAFLLEFSTVIVIIFTLLILGILKTLEGKDIATILAAIAGYVLGKATSAAGQPNRMQSETRAKPHTGVERDL